MDSLGSIALATEAPSDALLLRKPYGRNDPVLNPRMIKNVFIAAFYQLTVVLFLLYGQRALPDLFMKRSTVPNEFVSDPQSPEYYKFEQCASYAVTVPIDKSVYEKCVTTVRNTILFNSFVMMQLFNEINARKLHDELNVFEGIFSSWIFMFIIFLTLGIQIILIQFAGVAFEVRALNGFQWGICIAFGAGMLPWGLIMHLIPPCHRTSDVQGQTIIHGADDGIIKDISSQVSGLRPSKRLEAQTATNLRVQTATSTTILSTARRSSKQTLPPTSL
jgi:Ca2+ transporting ATPase